MKKSQEIEANDEVTEIIELAINDIDSLTRAFDVINQVCQELSNPNISFEPSPRVVIN